MADHSGGLVLLGGLALSIAVVSQAGQTTAPLNRCDSARFESRGTFGHPAVLRWKVPSAFPTPAHDEFESISFQISCPEFSAEQKSTAFGPGVFTIRGTSFQAAVAPIEPIEILQAGGCRYPTAHLECWNESIQVVIGADRLAFKMVLGPDRDASLVSLADSVVGVRVNNDAARPVFFEGKLIPEVEFGPTDVIELSIKETRSYGDVYDNVHVCRIAIDVGARTISLQSPPPPYTLLSADAIARACSAPATQAKKK